MSTIKVKAKAIRKVYNDDTFYIWGMAPIPPYDPNLKIHPIYKNFTVKGELSFITINKDYTLEIEELPADGYGIAYRVVSCDVGEIYDLDNLTRKKSLEIMNEITTPAQAQYCIDAYEDFIKIALTDGINGFDLKKIYNVGECRINAYVRELNTKFKYLEVANKLKDWKFDVSEAKKLCDKYEEFSKIKGELKNNPYYVIIDVVGRTFERADEIIIANRPDLIKSEVRCAYLIASVIEKAELEGDSKIDANDVYNYIVTNIPKATVLFDLIVPTVKNNKLFHYDEKTKMVSLTRTYNAEYEIATFFKGLVDNSTKLDFDWNKYTEIKDGTLTVEQQNILKHFCEYNLTIVNARGGTGKSATTMALMDMLDDYDMSYITLSPTGRVAKRMSELTGRPASTIHRAVYSHTEGIWCDVAILEEGGMIGIDLMLMFIRAMINPNVRIVINLDLGQIAPISCGCPMRDIIYSNIIDVNTLSEVFRYKDKGLAKMVSDAYDGKFYIGDFMNEDRVELGKNKDYVYVRFDGTLDQVMREYQTLLDSGIKPDDICVITPWNISDFGSININNLIQSRINPKINNDKTISRKYRGYTINFKVGDIVLNTENDYRIMTFDGYNNLKNDSQITKEDVQMESCMNGELGKVVNIEDKNVINQFDENILVFDKRKINNLMLGYSLNSYKMQGSQAKYIISLILPQFKEYLNKNIIYTDGSRAQKKLIEIIDPDTLAYALTIDATADRQTNMQDIFKEILAEGLDN